ncbi:MAG TPA: carboxymuconolactone decarboxylase family protein [Urbifossiella sp.]|nr:carboxymuconolactone decarboxylase family protein [Urbifossiella sp.]
MRNSLALLACLAAPVPIRADDPPVSAPRPTPLTRPEMKELIEQMKLRKPRIPLPELTPAEKEKQGPRGGGYEGRLRALYLSTSDGRGVYGFGGERDELMSLDGTFKTRLFWVVCRTNNCQYCQGHQESKLLRAGLTEDDIAALDGDWTGFTAADRAALAFARKLTYEPHRLTDADVAALRPHYSDLQVLEMIMSVAGNNAINRWKEGVGVPQSEGGGFGGKAANPGEKHTYLTPTSEMYKTAVSKVAPLALDAAGQPTRATVNRRPAPEPRAEAEKALATARTRTPRLPLVEDAKARAILPADWPAGPLPEWVRLLANFSAQGKGRILAQRAVEDGGDLSPLLKARVSWVVARQDRAWYAAGEARRRLKALGQTDDQIFALDGEPANLTPTERALLTVARNLAASPVVLTDDEVAAAVRLAGPRDVVQLINYVTVRASFDRITEAAGLRLES